MTLPNATHIGTFRGATLQRQGNQPPAAEPYHSLAHALLSGVAMAAFVVATVIWLGSL